jgi:hypothetical protein
MPDALLVSSRAGLKDERKEKLTTRAAKKRKYKPEEGVRKLTRRR